MVLQQQQQQQQRQQKLENNFQSGPFKIYCFNFPVFGQSDAIKSQLICWQWDELGEKFSCMATAYCGFSQVCGACFWTVAFHWKVEVEILIDLMFGHTSFNGYSFFVARCGSVRVIFHFVNGCSQFVWSKITNEINHRKFFFLSSYGSNG